MPEQLADESAWSRRRRSRRTSGTRSSARPCGTSIARYREVMHLVYVEGLKVDETARILGTPEGTVKTRLMRGREALKKILMRRNPEHFPS